MKSIVLFNLLLILSFSVHCQNRDTYNSDNEEIKINSFPGIYGSMCYVISKNNDGFIVDAGLCDSSIIQYLQDNNINIKYIFCTHSHIDHVLFAMDLGKATGAKTVLHKEDVNHYKYYTPERIESWKKTGELTNELRPLVHKFIDIQYDSLIAGGEVFKISDMKIEIIHTPGHSKGSICLLLNGKILFTGDTIYYDEKGNTDIDTGNDDDLKKSLSQIIFPMDDSIIIYQGHGEKRTMKEIRAKISD